MTLRVTLRVTLLKKGSLASDPYTLGFSEKCEGVSFFCKMPILHEISRSIKNHRLRHPISWTKTS